MSDPDADDRARSSPRSRARLRAGAVRRRNSSGGPPTSARDGRPSPVPDGGGSTGTKCVAAVPSSLNLRGDPSGELQDGLDGTVHMVVAGPFGLQLLVAGGGEAVRANAAPGVGQPPFSPHPALPEHLLQRRVERSFLHP